MDVPLGSVVGVKYKGIDMSSDKTRIVVETDGKLCTRLRYLTMAHPRRLNCGEGQRRRQSRRIRHDHH